MERLRHTEDVAVRQGPAATLEALYRAEYAGMVRLAFTLIGNAAEAEEVVQESFVDMTEEWRGDLAGTAHVTGTATPDDTGDGIVGQNRIVIDATVEGIGTGLLVIDNTWNSNPDGIVTASGTIAGGTGDFTGATGTFDGSAPDSTDDPGTPDVVELAGTYEIELVVPVDE